MSDLQCKTPIFNQLTHDVQWNPDFDLTPAFPTDPKEFVESVVVRSTVTEIREESKV
jgi:hypothetical protein